MLSTDGVRSAAANDAADASDGETPSNGDSPGNLFHCPACAIVYIATEKRVCSQCDGDVEQVRSTLSCR